MAYGMNPGMMSSYTNPYWGYGGFYGGYGTSPYATGLTPSFIGVPESDDEIQYFVENALDNDPVIPAHVNIGVNVRNGVVTLTGTVPNKRIKHAAGDDAWWVPPVVDVHNEIEVKMRRERARHEATHPTRSGR